MKKISLLIASVFLAAAVSRAGTAILAPKEGYVTGSGSVWLVTESENPPAVSLDGRKVEGSFTEEKKIRHLKVKGIKEGGSKLSVDGVELKISKRRGAPGEGEPRMHLSITKNCGKCHEVSQKTCKECHPGYGVGKHSGQKFAQKCSLCHADGVPTTEDMVKVCSSCHEKHSLAKHPKLRHPVTARNDPTRPGRKLDCASCHDPHDPYNPADFDSAKKQDFCKECHTTP